MRTETIERMKTDLLKRVDEWVGMDIPAKGAKDYETWQSKLAEIDEIENIQEVIEYVNSEGFDLGDFFLCGQHKVISAGLDPNHVPSRLFTELGELFAEQNWSGGAWVKIYLYDGKYFVVNEIKTSIVDTEADALRLGGIDNDSFGETTHHQVHQATTNARTTTASQDKVLPQQSRSNKRAVLVIVTSWPDGTMAFKFGAALRAALRVTKEDMSLIQMAPERIFRVETSVNEIEFRDTMRIRDVSSNGQVLFVEIPKS